MLIFKNMLLVSRPSHGQSRRRGQQPAVPGLPGWCQKVPREGAAPGGRGGLSNGTWSAQPHCIPARGL